MPATATAAAANMTTVFPSPPPTHNALSAAQRAQLVRTTSKLTRVLGHTPQVHDLQSWAALNVEDENESEQGRRPDLQPRRQTRRMTPAPAVPSVPVAVLAEVNANINTGSRSRSTARSRPPIPSFTSSDVDLPEAAYGTHTDELPPYHPTGPVTPPRRSATLRLSIPSSNTITVVPDGGANVTSGTVPTVPTTPATPDLSPSRPDSDSDTASLSSLASSWLALDSPSPSSISASRPLTPATPSPTRSRSSRSSLNILGRKGSLDRPPSPPVLRFIPSSTSSSFGTGANTSTNANKSGPARPFLAPGRAARLERLSAVAAARSTDSLYSLSEHDAPTVATPAFIIPSDASMRRAKMERLRRRLGECVPVSLVFPNASLSLEVEVEVPAHHDDDEDQDEEDAQASPMGRIWPSGIYEDQGGDEGEDEGDSITAYPSPERSPFLRPVNPISDHEDDGHDHLSDPIELASIEVVSGSTLYANAQLAKVRMPFAWRRKLDVIVEHD